MSFGSLAASRPDFKVLASCVEVVIFMRRPFSKSFGLKFGVFRKRESRFWPAAWKSMFSRESQIQSPKSRPVRSWEIQIQSPQNFGLDLGPWTRDSRFDIWDSGFGVQPQQLAKSTVKTKVVLQNGKCNFPLLKHVILFVRDHLMTLSCFVKLMQCETSSTSSTTG